MLELQSEPFLTYAAVVVGTVVLGSHGLIYLLSIAGLLLRPFSRTLWDYSSQRPSSLSASAVVLLYPWIHLWGKPPRDIARTPFRPSRLLIIHTLWLINSVGLWVGVVLYFIVIAVAVLFPETVGLDINRNTFWGWPQFLLISLYVGIIAAWSSLVWSRSLRRSLAHFRHMNSVENDGSFDAPGHYLTPFRKATKWAFATVPFYIGLVVLVLVTHPAPFG